MSTLNNYLQTVGRSDIEQINRSENDLSSHLKNALEEYGLLGVLDTSTGENRRKRPDISLYADIGALESGDACDVAIECKKPNEVSGYADLLSALVSDDFWDDKFIPYVRSNAERIQIFVLTNFVKFLAVPISNEIRDVVCHASFNIDESERRQLLNAAVEFDLQSASDISAFRGWCENTIRPDAIAPPALSEISDLYSINDTDELEEFVNRLADVIVGTESSEATQGSLLGATRFAANRLSELPSIVQNNIVLYTMTSNGGLEQHEAQSFIDRHFHENLSEFVSASIHSLIGRLFTIKSLEDSFCVGVDKPLIPQEYWIFSSDRFDTCPVSELPGTALQAISDLRNVDNTSIKDLASTSPFYEWLGDVLPGIAFRRLFALFFSHNFRDLDGDLLGRFFEIYSQRLDRQKRKELGQYYTPMPIVRHLWRRALAVAGEQGAENDLMVLDPGVGSGTFLVEGARQLDALGLSEFWERLFGFDISPQVIGVAQVNLYLAVLGRLTPEDAHHVGGLGLYPTDSLDPNNGAALEPVLPWIDDRMREFVQRRIDLATEVKRRSRFTLVIGNPPYRNNSRLTLAQVAERFPGLLSTAARNSGAQIRNIRDDYAWFFAAADHYVGDRGVVAFVVSDSFCYGFSYRGLRIDLLRKYKIREIVHLGRFVFRDVGPRISFVTIVLERRNEELSSASEAEPIAYVDLRNCGSSRDRNGGPSDPRFAALESAALPAANYVEPDLARNFSFFPGNEEVQTVIGGGVPVSAKQGESVFVQKWPGIITSIDKLLKDRERGRLAEKVEEFFEAAHHVEHEKALRQFNGRHGFGENEGRRIHVLGEQARMKGLRFEARKIVPVLTGSTHNDDAWYPSPALTSYIYFEPELRAPRNTNPGKFQGWGDMSQWREAASHEIVPKLAFTTSANPERGFKAFVLPDRWFVKLAAGTRQQLNYTGVENPLEQATLEGANNLSGNALRLFEEFRERGLDQEDFLLYIAGVYNSSLSHAYLSGQGGQVMRVPVSLDSEALQIAFEISEKARRVRDAKMLFWYLETGEDIPAEQVLTVMEESWIETLNFEKKSIVQGRYKGRDIIVANEGSREALENEIESGARSIDALARELFNVVNG